GGPDANDRKAASVDGNALTDGQICARFATRDQQLPAGPRLRDFADFCQRLNESGKHTSLIVRIIWAIGTCYRRRAVGPWRLMSNGVWRRLPTSHFPRHPPGSVAGAASACQMRNGTRRRLD